MRDRRQGPARRRSGRYVAQGCAIARYWSVIARRILSVTSTCTLSMDTAERRSLALLAIGVDDGWPYHDGHPYLLERRLAWLDVQAVRS